MVFFFQVSRLVSCISPREPCWYYRCLGYKVTDSFQQIPSFATPVRLSCQRQPVPDSVLQLIDDLVLQTSRSIAYLSLSLSTIQTSHDRGRDILVIGDSVWVIEKLIEQWQKDGWCCILLREQSENATQWKKNNNKILS